MFNGSIRGLGPWGVSSSLASPIATDDTSNAEDEKDLGDLWGTDQPHDPGSHLTTRAGGRRNLF